MEMAGLLPGEIWVALKHPNPRQKHLEPLPAEETLTWVVPPERESEDEKDEPT